MFFVDQPLLFGYCLLIGFFGGLVRDLFACSLFPARGKSWEGGFVILYEIMFAAAFAVAFAALSARLGFPDLRGYMMVAVVTGIIIYYKSLQIIVAFFKKICYNTLKKLICKRKNSEKTRGE